MIDLVVTADDFGIDEAVNDAVELAHRDGILTAASLMVTGPACADAVARARTLPTLGVGLHLDLVEGRPLSPRDAVPDLVDDDGCFHAGLGSSGVRLATSAHVREQYAREIDAQFAAFAATGLCFDHVNAHRHFHVHPILAKLVVEAAARYGAPALRAPIEPGMPSPGGWIVAPFARALRYRARRRGLMTPDRVFGLESSGRTTTKVLLRSIEQLDTGINELYLHPATRDDFPGHGPRYRHRAELEALLDGACRASIAAKGARLCSFRQILRRAC